MRLSDKARAKTRELYRKAERIRSGFQANHSIDPEGWYDSTPMERDDELFFYPVLAEDFAWWDADAREEALSDMDYVISCAHDTVLDTVAEWRSQAEAEGVGTDVVNELVSEYLPQMLARESALCEYRGKMIEVLAEAARFEWEAK